MISVSEQFEDKGDYALSRPVGEVTVDEGIDLLISAVRYARERAIERLLVDVTMLTGFGPPDFWRRVRLGERIANEAQSKVIVAIVAPAELIDAEKIGVQIARNRGGLCEVFTNEQDAVEWLRNPI